MSSTRTLFLLLFLAATACGDGKTPDTAAPAAEPARTAPAAVAMPDSYSADIAADVLARGGNAIDASIAASFVLAVTWPEAGNIGGGGFMVLSYRDEAYFLDYRETAPLAADRDMYLDADGNVVEGQSLYGHLAVGTPGVVAGLWAAHQRFGSLPWRDLVQPAIEFARDGFVVPPDLAVKMNAKIVELGGSTNFQSYFGTVRAGEVFRQPELADTLERIAEAGRDGFYTGETADLIVAEMNRGGGLITHDDLAGYEAVWREPLRANWRDFEILAAPPPSSGGFAVVQLLKMKDFLAHEFEGVELNSPQYIHLIAEIEKRVFADRAEYLGDTDFVDVPMDELLSDEYLRMRAGEVNPDAISPTDDVKPGLPESTDTTHFSIVDQHGNAVSLTTTLNLWFGSGVVVEGAGFLLNDEMDDFSIKPGYPNYYGVVGNEANAIEPGKRMLSSMSPTIILKDGEVDLVTGSPGGSRIITTVFQMIVNAYDFGLPLAEAIAQPRFHHQLLPKDLIIYRPAVPLPPETISALGDQGYRVEPYDENFGDLQTVQRAGTGWAAASDPMHRGESRVFPAPLGDRSAPEMHGGNED